MRTPKSTRKFNGIIRRHKCGREALSPRQALDLLGECVVAAPCFQDKGVHWVAWPELVHILQASRTILRVQVCGWTEMQKESGGHCSCKV